MSLTMPCLACRAPIPVPVGYDAPSVCPRCGVSHVTRSDGTTLWRVRPGAAEATIRRRGEADASGVP